jgi:hypothetical protein
MTLPLGIRLGAKRLIAATVLAFAATVAKAKCRGSAVDVA